MMNMGGNDVKGCVFNIQRYSVHDGPGIRTIVFLKGCPLRCLWCSNPESQRPGRQIGYKPNHCIGGECLRCVKGCPEQAVYVPVDRENPQGFVEIQYDACSQCQACAALCPAEAIVTYGQEYSVEEILDRVEQDAGFYRRSGGGLTVSGGEPLMQPEFTLELLREAKKRHIHTAIETTGYAEWETVQEIFDLTDYVLYDLKLWNDEEHRLTTGVSNQRILDNFKRLCTVFPDKPVKARTPVIPGINDSEEELKAIYDWVRLYPNAEYELLKYHRFGIPKYGYLGKEYQLEAEEMEDARFKELQSKFQYNKGITEKEERL